MGASETRADMSHLLYLALIPAAIPAWPLPLLAFVVALLVTLSGAAWFTRSLEQLSDRWQFSPGLLGLVGAVGANIPNYTASLTAFVDRQPLVGEGVIVGSNVYNVAIILGIAAFAVPAGRGLVLTPAEGRDVLWVARLAVAMALTTWVAIAALTFTHPLLSPIALVAVNLLTLSLFVLLAIHALRRDSHVTELPATPSPARTSQQASSSWTVAKAMLALALALGSVIIMVRAGQAVAADVHLPAALFSLVVLAIATSLPNTVVAYQLARTNRVAACVEEILSSNGVNIALGSALPLMFWQDGLHDLSLLAVDTPLMVALNLAVLMRVRARRFNRLVGGGVILVYVAWFLVHALA